MSGMDRRLPHRAPALLADEILAAGPDEALVRCRIPPESPFLAELHNGRRVAPAAILLEMAAQATAALRRAGPPTSGVVVSFDDARLTTDAIDAGAAVLARVRAGRVAPPLRYYSYVLTSESGGEELLTGTLAVYG